MTAETLDPQFQSLINQRTQRVVLDSLPRGAEFEYEGHRFIATSAHELAPDAPECLCVVIAGEKRGEVWHIDPATIVTLPERTLLPPGDSTAS